MTTDVLGLTIDTQEVRIQTDRLAAVVTGSRNGVLQWDMPSSSSNVIVDPVTYTAMLAPFPYSAAWDTTATTADPSSGYYRLGKASTNQAANASWIEHVPNNVAGNVYLYGLGVNTPIVPLGVFEANRTWWFSYYSFGQGEVFLQFEAIWGTVKLQIYSDGTVEVFKGALLVGSGNLGKLDAEDQPKKKIGGGSGGHKAQLTGQLVSFVIIPCRTRELLFLCNRGGAFHVTFEDIAKDDPAPVILPAGAMSYQIPHGQAMVQAAPVRFQTSGFILSNPIEFRKPPVAGAVAAVQAYWDRPNVGAVPSVAATFKMEDGTTAFVGDGSTKRGRVRVDFSADGKASPWIYGGSATFAAVTANTDGTHSQSLDAYTVEANLAVPEACNSVQLTIECKSPDAIDAVVAQSKLIGNRPIVAKIGTIAMLTGRTKAPKVKYSATDDSSRLVWECRDRWKSFETYEIADPVPWDGRRLKGVIEEIARYPGYPSGDMDVEDLDFSLPSQGQSSTGDWAVIPEAGDTCDKWLNKLLEDYARNAVMGWYPSATGPKFRFRTPASIGTTPSATIYVTRQAAISAGFAASDTDDLAAWRHVLYDGYEVDYLEPESNVIRVTGWDSRIDRAFQVYGEDAAAIEPTTVPAARPINWTGEPYPVNVFDPSITDAATAAYVFGVLRARLFYGQIVADIPCEMQFKSDGSPLWKGDVLRVDTVGNWRIRSLTVSHVMEFKDVAPTPHVYRVIRPAVYTCEFIRGSL